MDMDREREKKEEDALLNDDEEVLSSDNNDPNMDLDEEKTLEDGGEVLVVDSEGEKEAKNDQNQIMPPPTSGQLHSVFPSTPSSSKPKTDAGMTPRTFNFGTGELASSSEKKWSYCAHKNWRKRENKRRLKAEGSDKDTSSSTPGKRKERSPYGTSPVQNRKQGRKSNSSLSIPATSGYAAPSTNVAPHGGDAQGETSLLPSTSAGLSSDLGQFPSTSSTLGKIDAASSHNTVVYSGKGGPKASAKENPTGNYKIAVIKTDLMVTFRTNGHRVIEEKDFLEFRRSFEALVLEHLRQSPGSLDFGKTYLNDEGRIVVSCNNLATETFVTTKVKEMDDGKWISWNIRDIPDNLRRVRLSGFLPGDAPNKDTLPIDIHVTNPALGANSWKVVHVGGPAVRDRESGHYVWFSIPRGCLQELQKIGFKPKMGMRQMSVLREGRDIPYSRPGGGPSKGPKGRV